MRFNENLRRDVIDSSVILGTLLKKEKFCTECLRILNGNGKIYLGFIPTIALGEVLEALTKQSSNITNMQHVIDFIRTNQLDTLKITPKSLEITDIILKGDSHIKYKNQVQDALNIGVAIENETNAFITLDRDLIRCSKTVDDICYEHDYHPLKLFHVSDYIEKFMNKK